MTRRIAIMTHSTIPRGGVVHAINLAESLHNQGEDVVLIAPDTTGNGFFRPVSCQSICLPAVPEKDVVSLVRRRISEWQSYLGDTTFDIYHAQDPMSANALFNLKENKSIKGFLRTVHHIDSHNNAFLDGCQRRGVTGSDILLSVSDIWQLRLEEQFGRTSINVGNGVDARAYHKGPVLGDEAIFDALNIAPGTDYILSVGGVEHRKNSLKILEAFVELHQLFPSLHLVIAGGASLLDHSSYQTEFSKALSESGLRAFVHVTGVVEDRLMPSLYRKCRLLVYPSLMEGFGLCPLEALSCGKPVIVPNIRPFIEHFTDNDVIWWDSSKGVSSLIDAMRSGLSEHSGLNAYNRAEHIGRRFSWRDVAKKHSEIYDKFVLR